MWRIIILAIVVDRCSIPPVSIKEGRKARNSPEVSSPMTGVSYDHKHRTFL